jgi:hypothetical protein
MRQPAVAAARAARLDGRRARVEADDARSCVGRHVGSRQGQRERAARTRIKPFRFRFWTNAGLRADPQAKCPGKTHRPTLRVSRGQGRSRRRNETRLGEDTVRSLAIGVVAASSRGQRRPFSCRFELPLCAAQDESLRPVMLRLGFASLARPFSCQVRLTKWLAPGAESSIVIGVPPPRSPVLPPGRQ